MIKISLSSMERNLPKLFKRYDELDALGSGTDDTAIHRLRNTINPVTGRPYLDDEYRRLSIGKANNAILGKNSNIDVGYNHVARDSEVGKMVGDVSAGRALKVDNPALYSDIQNNFLNNVDYRAWPGFDEDRKILNKTLKSKLRRDGLDDFWKEIHLGHDDKLFLDSNREALGTTVYSHKKPYIDIDMDVIKDSVRRTHGAFRDSDIVDVHDAVLSHEIAEAKGGTHPKYSHNTRISTHVHPNIIQTDVRNAYKLPDQARRSMLMNSAYDMTQSPQYLVDKSYKENLDSVADIFHNPYDKKWKKMFKRHRALGDYSDEGWKTFYENRDLFENKNIYTPIVDMYGQLLTQGKEANLKNNLTDGIGRIKNIGFSKNGLTRPSVRSIGKGLKIK